MRDFEKPGRSVVMARNGMAATSHPLASLAAIDVLKAGGNAMDAAIAACATQGVVEPGSTGIGGDCFALYSKGGTDDIVAFNGSGWAPAAATPEKMQELGVTQILRQSAHAVTVPGAVDAWSTLLGDHGTRSLGELLQPAIQLAEEGFVVAPRAAFDWHNQAGLLAAEPNAARAYLPDGKAPAAGAIHRFPDMAATLRTIAEHGRDAFYTGDVAQGMVSFLQQRGGLHTLEDFASYRGTYVKPIKSTFRDLDIYECPPNGQGIIALLILNILSRFKAQGDALSADRLHIEIEATRLAYSVRNALLCDPDKAEIDTAWLLSDELADQLAARIDVTAGPIDSAYIPPNHSDTVYICVVDKDRNCASFINSIFTPYGSGQMAPGGILLHNRGQGFELTAGHPNAIGPHKRPLHTIIPGMAVRDGRVQMPFGVMGGQYQAMGHAHFISKVADFGMDLQSAIDMPRVFPLPGTSQVEVEGTVPKHTRQELAGRGFTVVPPAGPIGGAQAVWIDWETGALHGASDPRKDGCALGY